MKTRFVSFHNGNLNPDLLKAQECVFDSFGIPLEQIQTNLPHAEAIDKFLNEEEWDRVVLFDADCIPTKNTLVHITFKAFLETVDYKNTLVGAAQKSSHIPGSKNFIAPSFMILDRIVWEKTGRFSFKPVDGKGDVAELFSRKCEEVGVKLAALYPTSCEKPLWDLDGGGKFGYGTTFGDCVYHAFESNANHQSTQRFIEKCREICSTPE